MHGTLYETGGGRFDWIPASGDPVEGVENACDAPRGIELIPAWDGNRLIGYEPASAPRHDAQDDRLNLCLLYITEEPGADTESRKQQLESWAREWEHHFRTQDPAGDYRCGYQFIVSRHYPHLFFNPFEERHQIEGYEDFTHWGILGGHKPGLNGEAYLGSKKLAVYSSGDDTTLIHETGHMRWKRGHSNSPGAERADKSCLMGRARTGFNAFALLGMDMLGPVAEISESASVHLVPVEVEPSDLRNGEYHAAKVEHNGRKLLLSLRKTAEQHYCGVRGHDHDTLFVHEPEGRQWFRVRPNILDSTADETEIDGIHIRNLGGGVVQVLIDGPAPEPQPVEALPIPAGDEPTPEHSGVWHDPRYKHQGFDLTIHDGRLTGYWFGHHPRGKHGSVMGGGHNGKRWLVLDGHSQGGHMTFDALTVINGEPRSDGKGTIRFDGNTALLRWETKTYGREHYRLQRLTPPKENTGLYSFGDYSGISVAEYNGETFVYYYGPGQGGQGWYVMSGTRDNLEVMSVSSRHRSTHPGDVEVLGTSGFEGGKFRMLGRTYDVEPIL